MPIDDFLKLLVIGGIMTGAGTVLRVAYRYAMMRIRRAEHETELLGGEHPETEERLQRLEGELAELQERLDFAERLLTQPPPEPQRLPETMH